MKIAILGAEGTGKTLLSQALVQALGSSENSSFLVPDVLHEWCTLHGRTPNSHDHAAMATEQTRRVHASLPTDALVVDSPSLMTAVYSDLLFHDDSLYADALQHQRSFDLTLLTGLDLDWVPDRPERPGLPWREPFDARLRQVLLANALSHTVVYGAGQVRVQCALQAIAHHRDSQIAPLDADQPPWQWSCEKCSDATCEHHMFTGRLKIGNR